MLEKKVFQIYGIIVNLKWELIEPNDLTEQEKFRKRVTMQILLEELQSTLGKEKFEKFVSERKIIEYESKR